MNNYDSAGLEVTLRPTDINSLIRLAENSVRPRLQPGVTLNSVYGAEECVAVTDSSLLGQVMMNLLVNACKFTSKGSITFGYEEYEDELYFFVKDTGVGIASDLKDTLANLFENNDTLGMGLGLGLPVANSIVKRLGGSIGVESRGAGRGCAFWFTIPYQPSQTEQTSSEVQSGDSQSQPSDQPPVRDRLVILVAEDNNSNYLLFQAMLKKKYDVFRANDGLEAIEQFKKIQPDIILMDIQMPNMDGYEAVREIRKLSADIPVIAVTAYAFVTDRERIIENGFNGYVSKPINMGRLEQEIANCLAK